MASWRRCRRRLKPSAKAPLLPCPGGQAIEHPTPGGPDADLARGRRACLSKLQQVFQPMVDVVAVDEVRLLNQLLVERPGRVDALHHECFPRPAKTHQAFVPRGATN